MLREEGGSYRHMILSQRLQMVASLVTEGNRLADIGTDHGFVPVYLAETGRIPSAVAMDVNPGPLNRAREHIREHHLEDRIQTRLSDGLKALGETETDTILIAGMGGALCVRILEQRENLCSQVKELVLQPQSEIPSVRRYLERSGWRITQEKMVLEEGKYYQMMKCVPGSMQLDDTKARYGPCLMRDKPAEWVGYLHWQRGIYQKNLQSLEKASGERGVRRHAEILQELKILHDLLGGISDRKDRMEETG
jgi:tRNA (adenine22-N1)-methyltransferase